MVGCPALNHTRQPTRDNFRPPQETKTPVKHQFTLVLNRLDGSDAKMDGLSQKVDSLSQEVNDLGLKIQDLDRRVQKVEERVEDIDYKLDDFIKENER